MIMNKIRLISAIILLCVSIFSVSHPFLATEIPQSINQAHQQFANHQLTSEQLVTLYLKRIEQFNDNGIALNAVVQLNKNAINEAKALDKFYQQHGLKGPLHGIPVLLKDNIDTIDGMANTAGSIALKHNYPKQDAFLVQQLKQAGAIILGKTNLSEWANFRSTHASSGWTGLYGQTKNPYDITTSPCGSSSGSGVAVAANFALLAVGTETDGSVTCPASVNGIVGIKPSLGLISRRGIIPLAHSQDTAGSMAKSVEDAVIMLSAMIALDKNDNSAVIKPVNYIKHLKPQGLKGKRIGVVRNLMGYLPQVDSKFEQALTVLKKQGAIIVDNTNIESIGQWDDAEFTVLLYEFKADLNRYLANTGNNVPKSLAELITFNQQNASTEMPYFGQEIFTMAQATNGLNSDKYKKALTLAKTSAQQGIKNTLNKYQLDLLIAPTAQPAWKIDWINGDHYLGSATSPAAVSGYPHITVPMGYIHGLPVGISFFGDNFSEATLIEAAFGFEQATKHRINPVLP
jgi:amidase/aspartyl-tRNA(Asn)/glutamyl-tRNA(Gln) amidotransferase subunit A